MCCGRSRRKATPKNLGEVIADGGDHARLHVTTDLQAFGMIVTAEPYSAVRQPSDVVVMENEIRPDTMGKIEVIQAKYELLPRGRYTYVKPLDTAPPPESVAKVSMDQYETLLEVYQAQNAVQIAKARARTGSRPILTRRPRVCCGRRRNAGVAGIEARSRRRARRRRRPRMRAPFYGSGNTIRRSPTRIERRTRSMRGV